MSNNSDEKYNFQISKVGVWQIVCAVLAIALVLSWFDIGLNLGSKPEVTGKAVQQPTQQAPQQNNPTPTPEKLEVEAGDDPFKGDPNAPITIVEFSDFQCPYCGRFYSNTLPQLQSEYIDTGKVKFVYRDYPLSFHPLAQPASEAAECANEQGKFWEYHDTIFENQRQLTPENMQAWAQDIGLDMTQFKECTESNKYAQEVKDDFAYGQSLGVTGTPSFFVNGVKLVGAQPFERFKQVIDAELAAQ